MPDIRTEVIRMRITPELKAAVVEAAEKDGRSLSNYLEQLILKSLNKSKI